MELITMENKNIIEKLKIMLEIVYTIQEIIQIDLRRRMR